MRARFSQPAWQTVTSFWASQLGVSPETLETDGVTLATRPAPDGSEYVHFFRRESCLVVASSPALAPVVAELAAGHGPGSIFDIAEIARGLDRHITRLVGPTYLGYVDALDYSDRAEPTACIFGVADVGLLVGLRSAVTAQEWEHGGLDERQPMAGVVVDGELKSAAGYEIWGDAIAHVGVVTAPQARGRGYGVECVAAITRHAVARGLVAQYQTLYSNTAAMAIGRAVGFTDYASRIHVAATAT
jgi:ribosomal protein S18 acetylase RimI-like enzyme